MKLPEGKGEESITKAGATALNDVALLISGKNSSIAVIWKRETFYKLDIFYNRRNFFALSQIFIDLLGLYKDFI